MTAGHMAEHSVIAGVVAPLLVLAWARLRPVGPALPWGAVPAWSTFVITQWVFHLTPLLDASRDTPVLHAAEHLAFLAASLWFWLPVLGPGGARLSEPERALYLFLAAPAVDLVGVALMVRGDGGAAVAMLVGTLPIVAVAGIVTWRWLTGEERRAASIEGAHGAL